jgi:hypothetical protein
MSIQANVGSPEEWVPLTEEIFDQLYAKYCDWGACLTEIRERMNSLRDETRMGWKPPSEIKDRLDDLNNRDGVYAAKHMDTARCFLDAAEADAVSTKPRRIARIERLKERIDVLDKAFAEGWPRNNAGWEMYVGSRFDALFIDDTEAVVVYFEGKYAQCLKFAEDYRAGRIPGPSAPEDPMPKFKINLGPTLLGRKRK